MCSTSISCGFKLIISGNDFGIMCEFCGTGNCVVSTFFVGLFTLLVRE